MLKNLFWANDRSNWEADWQISQNILPPAEAVCDVADADSDAGTNFSQGLFFCHEGRKARRRSSFSYFACFSPASLFFFLAGGADTPSKYRHMLFSWSAVKPRFRVWMLQYSREITAVDNMKIEPAMRLMKIPHYQPWRPKLWFDRERKLRICLCFLKVPVGWGINRRQVLICKLRTQILLVQRTSIQVLLVVHTMFWSSRTTRRLRIWIPVYSIHYCKKATL